MFTLFLIGTLALAISATIVGAKRGSKLEENKALLKELLSRFDLDLPEDSVIRSVSVMKEKKKENLATTI